MDIGSIANILYKSMFDKLDINATRLKPTKMTLAGFNGDKDVEVKGTM